MSDRAAIVAELEQIRLAHDGVLSPQDVVEFARDESTALHSSFTWDDTEAAHQHRLWQARMIIRVTVEIMPQDNKPYRMYVSLKDDRTSEAGYRLAVDVLSDDQMRAQLLHEALEEFRVFREKYKRLKELAPLFDAAASIQDKLDV